MSSYIYIGLVLFATLAANKCDCKNDIPLKTIFQVVAHFKEVQACDRIFTTKYGITVEGVRHISYRAELFPCEKASTACRCLHNYLNQKGWLKGSKATCCNKNGHAILKLIGKPDPTIKNMTLDNPIDLLKATFDQFPTAEVENHNCRPHTSKDKNGCKHFKLECDLFPDSPCEQFLCDGISAYLNQDHWLGNIIKTCTVEGNLFHMDIHSASDANCKSES